MQLKGKKICFLGDSITQGCGTTAFEKTFHQLIKAEYGLEKAYNYGVAGSRIARKKNFPENSHLCDVDYCMRAAIIPKDIDVIVVFGGTNDYGHGDALLGNKDDLDVYTFYGALNTLFGYLNKEYPNAKVVCMTPLHRLNEDAPSYAEGLPLRTYVEAIKEIVKNYDVQLIDLYEEAPIDPADKEVVPDGLHPSDRGHRIMADFIAEKLLKM